MQNTTSRKYNNNIKFRCLLFNSLVNIYVTTFVFLHFEIKNTRSNYKVIFGYFR